MQKPPKTETQPQKKCFQPNWQNIALAILLGHLSVVAQADVATSVKATIAKSSAFKSWLTEHEATFAQCRPELKQGSIKLCDGTNIPVAETQKLFKMEAKQLVDYAKSKKIKVEVLCSEHASGELQQVCKKTVSKKTFQQFGFLHGQFDPKTETIFLRSDASKGSLIHELLHHKQFKNRTPILGRVYKKERLKIESALNQAFDLVLKEVQKAEGNGDIKLAAAMIPIAQEITSEIASYAKWQMLIDEWNIFLIYKIYHLNLGIPETDIELAKKNIAFICRDSRTSTLLKSSQDCADAPGGASR
jgi:hypothetical protein